MKNIEVPLKDLAKELGVGLTPEESKKLKAKYYLSWEYVPAWEGCRAKSKCRLIGVKVNGGGHLESVAGCSYLDRIPKKEFVIQIWRIIATIRAGKRRGEKLKNQQ